MSKEDVLFILLTGSEYGHRIPLATRRVRQQMREAA